MFEFFTLRNDRFGQLTVEFDITILALPAHEGPVNAPMLDMSRQVSCRFDLLQFRLPKHQTVNTYDAS